MTDHFAIWLTYLFGNQIKAYIEQTIKTTQNLITHASSRHIAEVRYLTISTEHRENMGVSNSGVQIKISTYNIN